MTAQLARYWRRFSTSQTTATRNRQLSAQSIGSSKRATKRHNRQEPSDPVWEWAIVPELPPPLADSIWAEFSAPNSPRTFHPLPYTFAFRQTLWTRSECSRASFRNLAGKNAGDQYARNISASAAASCREFEAVNLRPPTPLEACPTAIQLHHGARESNVCEITIWAVVVRRCLQRLRSRFFPERGHERTIANEITR